MSTMNFEVPKNVQIIEFKVPPTFREFIAREIISNFNFGAPFSKIENEYPEEVEYLIDKLKLTGIVLHG
jgi:hypothetical protein